MHHRDKDKAVPGTIIVIAVSGLASLAVKCLRLARLAPILLHVVNPSHVVFVATLITILTEMRADFAGRRIAAQWAAWVDDDELAVDACIRLAVDPWEHDRTPTVDRHSVQATTH